MLDKLVSKYTLSNFLEKESSAFALADENYKIIWHNKIFRQIISEKRLKGKNFLQIFGIDKDAFKNKPLSFQYNENQVHIDPLKTNKNINGFSLRISAKKTFQKEPDLDISQKNLFQKELQGILSLLVKQNSVNVLSEEILKRSIALSKSSFGLIIFFEEKNKYSFIISDPSDQIKDAAGIEKEISSNFSYINKWLSVNRRALIGQNEPSNIAYSLAETLHASSLIIAPCFFDNSLLAALIVGKKKGGYTASENSITELFASLLSFAISSIRTRELNAALELRLLQSQKLETIGKLTSGMAHDFNNLLSSIFGSLNLLKKKVEQNDDVIRLLDNIENCSIRAKDLTKGLLSYGKPTPKRKELIKPNLLLSEISKVISQTFPKKIKLDQNIDNGLHDMLGNATEIYQVLLNLCVNAKEAIEQGGVIGLRAKNIAINRKNMVNYPFLSEGNYVRFSVSDTGSGIKEENLLRIFDPYFSTKIKDTGSGLGLYVTYGIIKAHNGHVEVSSEEEKGTTFDVFFPAFEPKTADNFIPLDKIILLADDEIMLRDLLAELLESNGYNVIKVSSGVEALKILTEEIKVDLVILDYNMPEMNGLDCVEKIRELKFKMPVLLSTGSLSLANDFDLEASGVNSVLPKPYEFDVMLSTIKKLI